MKYWVDWEDTAFPQIRPIKEASEYETPLILREAKREILTHCQNEIEHWRMISQEVRKLRASTIK